MQLSVQGVGRLGQDVRLTETIIGGKPMRVVYNSLAIFQNASEPFWIDIKIMPPYSLKFPDFFKKGDRISFTGVLENRDKMVGLMRVKDVVLNVQKCEHLK
jgi:hypothetical protein